MKLNLNKIALSGLSCFMLLVASPLLQSCKSDEDPMKWVDLRYRVQDSYTVKAANPDPIEFQVKSTDPWEIIGEADWYTISPDKGEAGEKQTVTITCKENTSLDDRQDIITIKSDYWTGKKFTLIQKGTAFLEITGQESEMTKEGTTKTLTVSSNQKWTAKVTDGDSWLSITSTAAGEGDGTINIVSTANKGEKRTGIVTFYNRNGVVDKEIECTQGGITLSPATPPAVPPGNGKWFALQPNAQKFEVTIDADIEWTASKEDEGEEWYTINQNETTNNKLVIDVLEHTGSRVRTAIVLITSKADPGNDPVVKQVKFKQIYTPKSEIMQIQKEITSSGKVTYENLSPGEYLAYLKPGSSNYSAADFSMIMTWQDEEGNVRNVQYHIKNGLAQGQTSPWNNTINLADLTKYARNVKKNQDNVFGFTIEENADVNPAKGNFIWNINNELFNLKELKGLFNPDNMPWNKISGSDGVLTLQCVGAGGVYVDRVEFKAPVNWGD